MYQERCIQDINKWLQEKKIPDSLKIKIIDFLEEYDFFSENKYVDAFVRGKVNSKRWGRQKIFSALKYKQVSIFKAKTVLANLEDQYQINIQFLIEQKKIQGYNKQKLIRFMRSRGYEYEEFSEQIERYD